MKKIIQVGAMLIVLLTIVFYKNQITTWVITTFFYSEGVVIEEPNDYALNYQYISIQPTNDFYAKSKQHLYNIFYTGLNNGHESFYFFCDYDNCINDLNKMSEQELYLSLNNFVHPYNSYKKLYISITNYNKITISIVKTYNATDIALINQKMDNIEKDILNDSMTTEQKIKAFHDYIVNITKYDEEYVKLNLSNPSSTSHSALGPLFNGKSLCGGYTDVMSIFLNRLNIPNYRIASEFHIWNLVYINNEWLHLDATWDDPVTSNNTDIILDKFFLITTSKLEEYETEYHKFDKTVFPEANYN